LKSKLCRFRPLCFLALIVIVTIGTAMLSAWFMIAAGFVLCLILFFVKQIPPWFKIAAIVIFAVSCVSYFINFRLPWINSNSGLRGEILRYANYIFQHFMSEENAKLLHSMMFGGKNLISGELLEAFRVAGLAHALAVSGFNTALITAVFMFIFKIVKMPKRLHIFVLVPVLFFYTYLCSWQYPILRACIMCLVFVFAKNNLHSVDSLSTMSLAAIIILILFPSSLISASFLLSFGCVLGIIFFYNFFRKRAYIMGALSMYLAVTIASFPLVVYFFGCLPTYAVISSLLLLPLMSGAFCLGLIAIMIPLFSGILYIAEPLLKIVCDMVVWINKLPFAQIGVSTTNWWGIIFYFLGLIVLSRFVFLKRSTKICIAVLLFACYSTTLII
jgi:competence protein ComEC